MSLNALLQQRAALAVPPVPPGNRTQGTEKAFTDQPGSPGSLSSLENNEKGERTEHETTDSRQQNVSEPQRRTIHFRENEGTRESGARLAEVANEPPIPYATAEQLADNRRCCRQCRNLARDGKCLAAGRGELPMTSPRYEPDPDRLLRCVGYLPTAEDADQRHGRDRYPGLYRRLWAMQDGGR